MLTLVSIIDCKLILQIDSMLKCQHFQQAARIVYDVVITHDVLTQMTRDCLRSVNRTTGGSQL